jgi:hypothetical protein
MDCLHELYYNWYINGPAPEMTVKEVQGQYVEIAGYFREHSTLNAFSMNSATAMSNLTKFLIEPVRKNLDRKLEAFCYFDVCKEDALTTNNNGVDIISHQLELKFEGNPPIYISWETIEGWFQYSLCVSATSFCNGVETFVKKDKNWESILGKRLIRFEVYGYTKNIVTSTETANERSTTKTFHNEPHLLILHFEGEIILGIANFHLENDFVPKYATGDDIWIIFDKSSIECYIEMMSLELLDV